MFKVLAFARRIESREDQICIGNYSGEILCLEDKVKKLNDKILRLKSWRQGHIEELEELWFVGP